MTREQKIVATGAICGVAGMVLGVWLLARILPQPTDAGNLAGRLAYALKWQALAALPLLVMVGAIGNARAMGPAIDPLAGTEDVRMRVNIRVLDNTVQQLVLFFAGSMALAVSVEPANVRVIGAAAIVFVAARLVFWIGYRIDPLYRAAGFAGTCYLNGALLVAALWMAVDG